MGRRSSAHDDRGPGCQRVHPAGWRVRLRVQLEAADQALDPAMVDGTQLRAPVHRVRGRAGRRSVCSLPTGPEWLIFSAALAHPLTRTTDPMPAMQLKTPAPGDKIGKKIVYLAKTLAQALGPHGFELKARTLCRTSGLERLRRRDIVDLQGYKWNEGAEGAFFVNLSVQFPAVTEAVARMPSQAWRGPYVDRVDEVAGQVRRRLEVLLPAGTDWPDLREKGMVEIRAGTDLQGLAMRLAATVEQLAPGQPAGRAGRRRRGGRRTAGTPVRRGLARAGGRRERAARAVERAPGRTKRRTAG